MIDFLNAYGAQIASAVTALAGAVCAIVSLVKAHRTKVACDRMIQDAQSRCTQVICPKCHKKSPLSQVTFQLPDGSTDNNLNGIPDHEE